MHMALLGKQGLVRVARQNMARALRIKERFAEIGLQPAFTGAHFNEVAYKVPGGDAAALQQAVLDATGIVPGLALGQFYPGKEDLLLVCSTEVHSPEDVERLIEGVQGELS